MGGRKLLKLVLDILDMPLTLGLHLALLHLPIHGVFRYIGVHETPLDQLPLRRPGTTNLFTQIERLKVFWLEISHRRISRTDIETLARPRQLRITHHHLLLLFGFIQTIPLGRRVTKRAQITLEQLLTALTSDLVHHTAQLLQLPTEFGQEGRLAEMELFERVNRGLVGREQIVHVLGTETTTETQLDHTDYENS
jgi:hypothetical protein